MPSRRSFDTRQVTRIVLDAIALGLPLIETIMQVMDLNYTQARHRLKAVRKDGYLGRKEHHPARATIHRGASKEKNWVVCEACLSLWPCEPAFTPDPGPLIIPKQLSPHMRRKLRKQREQEEKANDTTAAQPAGAAGDRP